MRRSAQPGFSLVEILVTIVILGIVLALGVPSYNTWIQNVQIRTASESIMNGLQTARNEAVRRNTNIQFRLDDGTNSQWRINPSNDPDGTPLQSRSADEGSPNVTITRTPGDADTVTFNALGRVVPNADASTTLTQVDLNNLTIPVANERRNMRIVIPTGGGFRMCDPKVAAGDPRAC